MIRVTVSSAEINFNQLHTENWLPHCGAVNSFLGVVRDTNHGKKVINVSYDAYIPMAEKVLHEIATEAQDKWVKNSAIIIHHRTGKLNVGESSVAIIVNTPHRDESFQMCRYIIEELKVRVPIWKKETYETGATEWLRGHALC